jgi:hypothetical protein
MRMIPWVDVIERKTGTDNDEQVVLSYPFPDINITNRTIPELKEAFTKMKDPIMRDCYETRLHFIMNSWHPRNFIKVSIKEWKYKT